MGRCCCVVGCKNTRKNNPALKFHRFPNHKYDVERKKKWIIAVRRVLENKDPWIPNDSTRICSSHFVNGKMSNDCRSESYIPTIFPWNTQNSVAAECSDRLKNKLKKSKQPKETINNNLNEPMLESKEVEPTKNLCNVEVQTDYCTSLKDNNTPNYLFCTHHLFNEASVQTVINCITKPTVKKIIIDPKNVESKNASVGPDHLISLGFHEFCDIKDDKTMIQMTGVSVAFFNVLLSKLKSDKSHNYLRTLNYENRLLLFLMKMKLGMTFTILSCLFHVCRKTVSTIFFETLNILYNCTRTWIFWPSKEAVQKNIPASFKNYPNCRAIIDCVDILIDIPPTVELRDLMYSNCKSKCTIKYLVAITPSGFISYISQGYGGKSTDEFIAKDSGFISLLKSGDEVMADEDFAQIQIELLKKQSTLLIPPFAQSSKDTREEVPVEYSISRAIQRIKSCKILDNVPNELLSHIDQIMFIACVIANNKQHLIRKETDGA